MNQRSCSRIILYIEPDCGLDGHSAWPSVRGLAYVTTCTILMYQNLKVQNLKFVPSSKIRKNSWNANSGTTWWSVNKWLTGAERRVCGDTKTTVRERERENYSFSLCHRDNSYVTCHRHCSVRRSGPAAYNRQIAGTSAFPGIFTVLTNHSQTDRCCNVQPSLSATQLYLNDLLTYFISRSLLLILNLLLAR